MALEYFLYNTGYSNTLVCRGDVSFAPVPPYQEIYINYFIPETQPVYLYKESGGTIVINNTTTVDEYLMDTAPPATPDDYVRTSTLTGYTASTGSVTWGTIGGTLSNQPDLWNALTGKTSLSIYKTYTGTTAPATFAPKSITITGATNGLTKYNNNNVCLGGTLTGTVIINSGSNIYCIAGTQSSYYQNNSSACMTVGGASMHQVRVSLCGATLESCCSKLLVYSGGTTFISGAVSDCAGIKYANDYSATYTDRSLIDRGYALGQFTSKSAFNTYTGTTAPAKYVCKAGDTMTGNLIVNAAIRATGLVSGSTVYGSTCVYSPIVCGTSCVISPLVCGSTKVQSPIITGSTCVTSPTICSSTCLCSTGTARFTGAVTDASTLNVSGATKIAGALTALSTFNVSGNTTLSATARSVTPATTDRSTCIATTAFVRNYLDTLTGGSSLYLYQECTTICCTTSITCVKYLGLTGTSMAAGRYSVDFSEQIGQAGSNNCAFGAFKIDNVTQGGDFLLKMNYAGFSFGNTLQRDVTLTAGTHCFDIYYWNGGGTACASFGSVRVRRIY